MPHTGLRSRGLHLEYATLGWNVVEIGFLVFAAVTARSVALAGFALDSVIEIFASLIVVGQLRGDSDPDRERRAIRRIGVAFLALAAFISVQTAATLAAGVRPDASPLGIAWLSATVVVMLGLATAKLRTGRAAGSRVLQTEAKVTFIDGALAAAILVGLTLNATLGWWWADLVGGAVLVGYGIREGAAAIREST